MRGKIAVLSTMLFSASSLSAQTGGCRTCSELNAESFEVAHSVEVVADPSFEIQESTISSKDMVFLENGDIKIVKTEFDLFNGIKLEDETIAEEPYTGSEEQEKYFFDDKDGDEAIVVESRSGISAPGNLKAPALEYFRRNVDRITNRKYIGLIDFSKHSSKPRFFIIKVEDESVVDVIHVAHGSGSDPDNDGYATLFSNLAESRKSSLGFYLTGALYTGKHGKSMRLHGLSSTNSNALPRAIVIHEAVYVREADVQAGRSWGCPAVAPDKIDEVIKLLKGGALIYAGLGGK